MKNTRKSCHESTGCSRTYATLCIYHPTADPSGITKLLRLAPERLQRVGEPISSNKKAKVSGWFLGTKDICMSKDLRVHLKLLIKKLAKKKGEIQTLYRSGHEIWISCFWESIYGNGGPFLDHKLLLELSQLPIDLNFDIWFSCFKR
jgi:hypothetical protein